MCPTPHGRNVLPTSTPRVKAFPLQKIMQITRSPQADVTSTCLKRQPMYLPLQCALPYSYLHTTHTISHSKPWTRYSSCSNRQMMLLTLSLFSYKKKIISAGRKHKHVRHRQGIVHTSLGTVRSRQTHQTLLSASNVRHEELF